MKPRIVNQNNTGKPTIIGDEPILGLEIGMTVKYRPVNESVDKYGAVTDIVQYFTSEWLDTYYVIEDKWLMKNEIFEVLK